MFFKPSIADVIEIGGVIIPSASNDAPPIIAGITSHFRLLLTRAYKAKVPPSPLLSALKIKTTYLMVVWRVRVQMIQDKLPRINASSTILPFMIEL